MNQDGMRQGYDIPQLKLVRRHVTIPLIASGGAGALQHFADAFIDAHVDGALAASVFHKQVLTVGEVKEFLRTKQVMVRS
jgi:cyclase